MTLDVPYRVGKTWEPSIQGRCFECGRHAARLEIVPTANEWRVERGHGKTLRPDSRSLLARPETTPGGRRCQGVQFAIVSALLSGRGPTQLTFSEGDWTGW